MKINGGIVPDKSIQPLTFVIPLIPLTQVLRKMKQGYPYGKRTCKIKHLLFMDDPKI